MTDSVAATIAQGGPAGSAVARLNSASARPKSTRSRPPNDATSNAASTSALSLDVDASDPESSDDEFSVANPLYIHGARADALPPSPGSQSLLRRVTALAVHALKTPTGRVVVTLTKPNPELRVVVSINGCAMANDSASVLSVPYYRAEPDPTLGLLDEAELQVSVSKRQDDSFVGAGAVPNVNTLPIKQVVPLHLELFDVVGAPAGFLDMSVQYHRYSFVDSLRLRVDSAMEYPVHLLSLIKLRLLLVPPAVKSLIIAGLPGLHGGAAASWVIFGFCALPFALVSLLTNWSFALRQWFFVVPVYAYFTLSFPLILGWLLGTLITVFAMHGYPGTLKFGAIHITPWITGWNLSLRITVFNLAFGNPPGFPLENFIECRRIDISGRMSFSDLLDLVTFRYKKCPLSKVPDFRYLIKFDIDYLEFEDFMVDFQMYDGKFNIHAFTRQIAEGEAKNLAWMKGYMKSGDPMPNELEVRIIRCKDLVKTRTSRKTLRQQVNEAAVQQGPLGHNAVIEAFAGDVDEMEDAHDSSADEDDASEPASGRNSRGSSGGGASPFYKGLGPPNFNPADASVKPKANQGHFDPYVVVTLRRDKQKTHTQTKTNSPMFNQTFFFHATDAATVVHGAVYNREVVGGDVMLGQWIMTLKWMLGDPTYCWHEKGMQVTKDRWMRGWFPLMNKRFRGIGKCGKIEMALQWRYVPEELLKRRVDLPPLSALQQLQENSDESRMRMGDMQRVKYWLNHEPFLFDMRRMTVRGFKFHLQDLFRGYKGRAEAAGNVDKIHYINLQKVEWLTEFRPKKGDAGITTYKMLLEFFAGIAPKVLDLATSHANVGSTFGTIASSSAVHLRDNMAEGLRHLVRGEATPFQGLAHGLRSVGKATDRAVQVMHRTVTANKKDEQKFKVLVDAEDEDFLIEVPELCGFMVRYGVGMNVPITDTDMEKEVERKGQFSSKYFELKGLTLFYRKTLQRAKKREVHALTYKIDLRKVAGAIWFVDKDELVLNHGDEGFITRLRFAPWSGGPGEEEIVVGPKAAGLQDWIEAFKAKGVKSYVWRRGAKEDCQ